LCCSANLLQYDSVSNEALQEAWLAGFEEAQSRATEVEMKDVLLTEGKWEKPWPSSFTESLTIIDSCAIEIDDDSSECVTGAVDVSCGSTEVASSIDDELVNEVDVLVRTSALDVEQQIAIASNVIDEETCKISPTIDVSGKGLVFKMRLIAELNTHSPSKLPIDRLRRVQYKACIGGSHFDYAHDIEEVGLFDDVAVIMEEGNTLTWYLGRVQKMVKNYDKGGSVDYMRPINLKEEGIKLLLKYYKHVEGLCYSYGGYGGHEADFVCLNHIICLVSLRRDVGIENFLLMQEDKSALDSYLKNSQMQRRNNKGRSKRSTAVPVVAAEPSPRTTPLIESRSILPSTMSQISHMTRSGRHTTRIIHH
jgi:hypothetical protein